MTCARPPSAEATVHVTLLPFLIVVVVPSLHEMVLVPLPLSLTEQLLPGVPAGPWHPTHSPPTSIIATRFLYMAALAFKNHARRAAAPFRRPPAQNFRARARAPAPR